MPQPAIALPSSDSHLSVQTLQHRLAQFNAKERFALVKHLLGVEFLPHSQFMSKLLKDCKIEAEPQDIFCAMDFHLDWLYAALMKTNLDDAWKRLDCPVPIERDDMKASPVTGSQQDADFVICFSEDPADVDSTTHLFLIEAKGIGQWSTRQLSSKLSQYRAMKPAFERNPNVKTWLVLLSPRDPFAETPQKAELRHAREEAQSLFHGVTWHPMPMTETLCVVRCNAAGTPDGKTPTHWKVMPRRVVDPDAAS